MKIPALYLEKISPLVCQARKIVEGGDALESIAFVGNLSSGDMVPIMLDDSSQESKDNSAEAIRMTAELLEADYIFQIREAWVLSSKNIGRYEAILEKYGSIGASPYAEDMAVFSLETTHGTWMAAMPLKAKPPSKKRRTFSEATFEYMKGIEGRFTGLLKKKENDGGSLH